MSQEIPDDHITRKEAVLRLPGMERVIVRRDVPYLSTDTSALTMDLYSPAESWNGELRPAVVSILGYPDPGMERIFGRPYKDWGSSTSWARLIAASGLVAITYSNREPGDIHSLLGYLYEHGADHGIDSSRIGLLAVSGHAPLALSVLMPPAHRAAVRCAAFLCPFLLDLEGSTAVLEAATIFRFANPSAGKTLDDLPKTTPLFIARAGEDQMPGLNETLDRFVAKARDGKLDLSVVNHPHGTHAFDVSQDSEESREAIRAALVFLRRSLLGLVNEPEGALR